MIASGNMPRLFQTQIATLFGLDYEQLKAVHPIIYEKLSSEHNFEDGCRLAGVTMAEEKGEGAAITVDTIDQVGAERTFHKQFGKKIGITDIAFEDNLYKKYALDTSRELAKSLFHAKETYASSFFNNATSTSAPFANNAGEALLSATHATGKGGTVSNLIASDFSDLALKQAVINISNWRDEAGLLMLANVKALLIPNDLMFEADTILESELLSGSADHDINSLRNMKSIPKTIKWRFLTDLDSWFLLTDVPNGLKWYERRAPQMDYYRDDKTKTHYYDVTERYSFDWIDWRGVYGSVGV